MFMPISTAAHQVCRPCVTPGLGRGMALCPGALRPLAGVGGGMRLALASLLLGSPGCSIASNTCSEDTDTVTDVRRLQGA